MITLVQPFHHGYGVSGNVSALVPEILRALEKSAGFLAKGNPDFREERYEVLGIDEARTLKESAERAAVTGGKKVFIVSASGITKEAQNALLKILEEPPPETHFFLIVPSFEILLSTLRSRLFFLSAGAARAGDETLVAEQFLALSAPARLVLVQGVLKELEEERKEKEDSPEPLLAKGRILSFLDALELSLAQDVKGNASAIFELLTAKKYARDRAPSLKLLLEHLALALPQVKQGE